LRGGFSYTASMISRRTTHHVQMLYDLVFTEDMGFGPVLHKEKLHDFLYEDDHEGSFLDLYKRQVETPADLKNLILNLHTGMAWVSKTQTLETKKQIGQQFIKHLALSMLRLLDPYHLDFNVQIPNDPELLSEGLKNALVLDNYIYKNDELLPIESSVIDEEQEQSYLESLLDSLTLADPQTIRHHLKLSEEHYIDSKWDDSISNARKVLDGILTQIASKLYSNVNNRPIPPEMLKNATDIRNFLERQNVITKVEREALDKNYGALSATGGHPYIAEKDQARLMRHLALTFSQFVLLRYQGFLSQNP
jgi:hypothetical protein